MKIAFRFAKWAYILSVIGAAMIAALAGSAARSDGGWSLRALAYMFFGILPYVFHGWLARTFQEPILAAIVFLGTLLSVFFSSSLYLDALFLTKNIAPWPMFIEIPMAQFKFLAGLTVLVAIGRLMGIVFGRKKTVSPEIEKTWTRENVLKTAADAFPEENLGKVMSILDLYGRKETEKHRARVHLAVIRLSFGDLDKLFETSMEALDKPLEIVQAAEDDTATSEADASSCNTAVADGKR